MVGDCLPMRRLLIARFELRGETVSLVIMPRRCSDPHSKPRSQASLAISGGLQACTIAGET